MEIDPVSDAEIRLAKTVMNELQHQPLLIDVVNKVSQLHNEGLTEDQIVQATTSYFSTKSELPDATENVEPEEIRIHSLPNKYQRLDWR